MSKEGALGPLGLPIPGLTEEQAERLRLIDERYCCEGRDDLPENLRGVFENPELFEWMLKAEPHQGVRQIFRKLFYDTRREFMENRNSRSGGRALRPDEGSK